MTDLKIIESRFKDHCDQNGKDFASLTLTLKNMNEKMTLITDNHLQHLKDDVSGLKIDMDWVKKIQWFAMTTAIGNLIGIIYLIIQK